MSNKAERIIAVAAGLASIAGAIYLMRRPAGIGVPGAQAMYHARNNPNGFTWSPSVGAYIRTNPDGVQEIYT